MKRKVVAAVMFFSMVLTPMAHAGGIPVFDASNLAQQIKSSAEELFQLIEQVTTLKQQYDQLQQTYKALTGARNLGDVLNNPLLKDYIPADWKNVYDSVKSGGYQGLTGAGQAIRDANKVFDICASMTDPTEKQACNRQANKAAQDMAFGTEAFDKTKDRLKQIESLMKKVGETEDQKEALEMIGRVQAESAMIQNEMTRMQLFAMLSAAEEKLLAQQQREFAIREQSKTGGLNLDPKGFNIKIGGSTTGQIPE